MAVSNEVPGMDFKKMALSQDDLIDPARAALLIARIAYPDMDESFYLAQIETMAVRLKARIAGSTDIRLAAGEMTRLLFEEEGFRGNNKDYYDPDNSFLNCVLDRRTGIPITLSLLLMEVGRRAGLTVRGIGMPGHFIAGLYGEEGRILIDAFYRGAILDEDECRRRIAHHYGGWDVLSANILDPVRPKEMLARLLRNLKGIYRRTGDDMRLFQVLEWIISLNPETAVEYKERGLLYENLGAFDRAVRDFRKYLSLSPYAVDAEEIRNRIEILEQDVSRFH